MCIAGLISIYLWCIITLLMSVALVMPHAGETKKPLFNFPQSLFVCGHRLKTKELLELLLLLSLLLFTIWFISSLKEI